jgi:hypothetical protein
MFDFSEILLLTVHDRITGKGVCRENFLHKAPFSIFRLWHDFSFFRIRNWTSRETAHSEAPGSRLLMGDYRLKDLATRFLELASERQADLEPNCDACEHKREAPSRRTPGASFDVSEARISGSRIHPWRN